MHKGIFQKGEDCHAYPAKYKRLVAAKKPYSVDATYYGGPEYEIIAALGLNCDIDEIGAK